MRRTTKRKENLRDGGGSLKVIVEVEKPLLAASTSVGNEKEVMKGGSVVPSGDTRGIWALTQKKTEAITNLVAKEKKYGVKKKPVH